MNIPSQLARHVREVHIGVNWTWVNLKDSLAGVSWQQATTKLYALNTIAALVYHINYYVNAVSAVLERTSFDFNDKYSFDHPPVQNEADWETLMNKSFTDAEKLVSMVEQLPDEKLSEIFVEDKYGSYYRNIQGVVEHAHYHLGQIVLIKKILAIKPGGF